MTAQTDSGSPTPERDLFGQVADATRDVLGGAGDAYRETFEELQARLPGFDDILAQAVRLPGTRVDRADYLARALGPRHASVVARAIETTPRLAGLSPRQIERLAKRSVARDARRTTALSFAAGIPGGAAAAATIPADLVQFYGHLIRTIQKLSYLYGWRDLVRIEEGEADLASSRALVLLLGVMSEVDVAQDALARLARLRAAGADDTVLREALLRDAMAAQTEEVSAALARNMARRLGGRVVDKAVPLVGGVISGVVTHGDFGSMSRALLHQLKRCDELGRAAR